MLKKLSLACGGELSLKDVAKNCMAALCALATIALWIACCYSLASQLSV